MTCKFADLIFNIRKQYFIVEQDVYDGLIIYSSSGKRKKEL